MEDKGAFHWVEGLGWVSRQMYVEMQHNIAVMDRLLAAIRDDLLDDKARREEMTDGGDA